MRWYFPLSFVLKGFPRGAVIHRNIRDLDSGC
jgi:hypothetical protein